MTATSPCGKELIILLTTVVFPEPVPPAIPIIIMVTEMIFTERSYKKTLILQATQAQKSNKLEKL